MNNKYSFHYKDKDYGFSACIFDFDGVIMDTEKYHFLAWQKACESFEITLSEEEYLPLRSTGRIKFAEYLEKKIGRSFTDAEKIQLFDCKQQTFEKLSKNLSEKDLIEGIVPFLEKLAEKKVKTAVASSSSQSTILMEKHQLNHYFTTILNGTVVAKKKPSPDIFLETAKRLNIPPQQCLVFEDSLVGVQAAVSAGMQVIVVGKLATKDAIFNIPDFTVLL